MKWEGGIKSFCGRTLYNVSQEKSCVVSGLH